MLAPRIVAVVGFKASGKTQVVESLVRELTNRGLHVGTLKHASRTHLLDTPGKDTWRHREAGSIASAILTSNKSAIFLDNYLSIADAIEMLGPVDIVVLEGFKSLDAVARILVPREKEDIKKLTNGLEIAISSPNYEGSTPNDSIPVIPLDDVGKIADLVESKPFPLLAGLDCGGCGFESCVNLAKAILKEEANPSLCVKYWTNAMRLKVDERNVEVNPFITKVMRNVVLGMTRTLKGGKNPKRIELSFDVPDKM